MPQLPGRSLLVAVVVAGLSAMLGCGGTRPPRSVAVNTDDLQVEDRATSDLHQRLLDDANNNYTKGSPKNAVSLPSGSLDHGDAVAGLSVVAKPLTFSGRPPAAHQFVADFVSNKKYKKLGLGENDNYVLMLPQAKDTMYVMVPSDLRIPMRILEYDSHFTFYHTPHDPPQVVKEVTGTITVQGNRVDELVIGGCVEGPCPTGHCGFAETSGLFTLQSYQQFINRNRKP